MGKSKIWVLIGVWTLMSHSAVAQTNRYVVYFTDKNDTEYTVDHPIAYLSQRAIDRRENQNIEITSQDFPVNKSYVEAIQALGVDTYFTSRWMNAVLVEATPEQIETIEEQTFVSKTDYAAPGQKLNTTPAPENTIFISNDPTNPENLNSDIQLSMLQADLMLNDNITGEGVWVAVFDDGFLDANISSAFAHTFENDGLKDVFDFTTGGKNVFQYDAHGTSAWSCLGAKYNSTLKGSAYNASISLYVTEDVDTEYRIEEYNWLFAAERADSVGIDIITASLGYTDFDDPSMNYVIADLDGQTAVVTQAAEMAIDRGILVVTSGGNSGTESWPYISMPADAPRVLSVGALTSGYDRVSFSSIGPTADDRIKPEVVALGVNVTVLAVGNVLDNKSGTSFAAPLVAGVAAGLWQKFPTFTNLELRDLILSSSDNFENPNNEVGYGLPSYNIAIGNEPLAVSKLVGEGISVFPNPVSGDHINLSIEKKDLPMPVNVRLLSPSGQLISEQSIKKARKGLVLELPFNGGSQGIYFLQIECEDYSKNVKILRY
ncbi:S8 family peptidase [Reichenbachiella carrageenanivorans]|uniref:S8 family peptidase n=1 Tax=Reichenbachiella carrageenanivorans TaxID=2979869 RepID=A0ABY6CY35_9BACT|nr:S8 family peptidase [Reichenbachiella carrageenanivorans]UXX78639.1 S8 family peptidase [Reichenbachiella carrageenanivorans]